MNKVIVFIGILLMPIVAVGATLQSFISSVGYIGGLLLSVASTLAIVVFFYGLALFILNSTDEKKVEEGKSWMFWGIIALFVLITIWGIIGLLQRTVGNTKGPGSIEIIIPSS